MIWDLNKFSDNIAVIEESGKKTTYGELAAGTEKLAQMPCYVPLQQPLGFAVGLCGFFEQ